MPPTSDQSANLLFLQTQLPNQPRVYCLLSAFPPAVRTRRIFCFSTGYLHTTREAIHSRVSLSCFHDKIECSARLTSGHGRFPTKGSTFNRTDPLAWSFIAFLNHLPSAIGPGILHLRSSVSQRPYSSSEHFNTRLRLTSTRSARSITGDILRHVQGGEG